MTRRRRLPRWVPFAAVAFALIVAGGLGCGSSAATSPAEAKAVAVAEGRFLKEWAHAYKVAVARCQAKSRQGSPSCRRPAEPALEAKARARFTASIERLLEAGVGPKCAEELEETLATITSVPEFPGGTASVCRGESRE